MGTTTSKIVTYEEWLRLPETRSKEEVVDGEIIVMPPTKYTHSYIVQSLQMALVFQLDPKIVWVMTTVFGLVIRKEPLTCREPDLAIFVRKNIVQEDGYIHSAPELIVEVLSPANTPKMMIRKQKDYASIGVPELWVVSPEEHTFEVLQLEDGQLRTKQILNQGQLRPLRFPETQVEVASVWPD